jgi:hypothetical protein
MCVLPAASLLPSGALVLRRLLSQADALHPPSLCGMLLRRLLPEAHAVHRLPLRAVLLRRLLPQADAGLVLPAIAAGRLLPQRRHGVQEEGPLGWRRGLAGFSIAFRPNGPRFDSLRRSPK